MPLFGHIAIEWVAALGFAVMFSFGIWSGMTEVHNLAPLPTHSVVAGIVPVLYAWLRLVGRAPIGIVFPGTPAARGHPMLSAVASVTFAVVWAIVLG